MLHRINIKKFRAWHTESIQQKTELSYMVDRNVNWCSHYGKLCRQTFLKKVKIGLFSDPVTWLQGIYPNKTIIQKDTCTYMFIAALYIITKTRKQLKWPSTDEWIQKIWNTHKHTHTRTHTHTHTRSHTIMEYYSAIKEKEIMPFEAAAKMDPDFIILREVKREK